MAAVEDGDIEVLRPLDVLFELSPGAQARRLKVGDSHGWTTLHDAAFHGFEEAVDEVLNAGANAGLRTNDGYTALDLAARQGRGQVAERIGTNSG